MSHALPRRTARLAAAVLLLGGTLSCAVNPATGKREFMIISQDQEIAMGREYDPQIVASIGLYPDTALQRYVQALGAQLAAQSERPGLPWTFRVLDDPQVNAFAVPGGFIYITRGILAHLGSEAQLAAVIGHEIGHVTARHSASQMSREQLAQIGLAVGVAVDQRLAGLAQAAGQGLGILFLKYGREDENEADALGLRYMRRTKHDVREMPGVFTMLGAVGEAAAAAAGEAAGKVPDWLSTHPNPADRFTQMSDAITKQPQDTAGVIVGRNDFLRRLDNVVFDVNPRQGYFAGTRFLHPDMRFQLVFPTGWRTANEASAVRGMSAEQDAALQLRVSDSTTADAAMRGFVAAQGMTAATPTRAQLNGLATAGTEFAAVAEGDTLRGAVRFIEHAGMVFELVGYAPRASWAARQAVIDAALRSFAVLTDRTALAVQPQRLDIITLDRRASIAMALTTRPSPLTAERLGLINQSSPGTLQPVGTVLKWVVGQPLP